MEKRDVRIEAIPKCLIERPQWVCWKYVPRPNAKPIKKPMNALKGGYAKPNDPNTWTTFENALETFKRNASLAGIGYVFLENDPYTGIDLDDCLDENGEFIWGKEIVERFDTRNISRLNRDVF